MVATRTTSIAANPEGRDRQNPKQLPSADQNAAGPSDPQGPVTREEFQLLMQELTQSRQHLTQQLRVTAELTNRLNHERRRRSKRDQASYSSTESSASSDYHHRSTRPQLDGSYTQATGHQHTLNVGKLRVGPSTNHQTGPSSRGGAVPHHTVEYRTTNVTAEPRVDAQD